ncbi:PfaD family polyunsaturated fatty acid/polyketide biosynthesis protein [Ilumatobacter coccineus]|uniref:Omega-3 polyunsaturated fatty acid synthase PfaD n=1 Tax=Ilumatobacter coccineus (strain NBRC 103263 / KCTC 29153 / YM16-304) TaxID=1313172 RepID=A0A6C7E3Y0_ILUCY|nr:PfaD family polyunsaturated fatty acid/polyketide biosynthesis protein [Ilumatobacter coccineus]BAN01657.1 omega-3 polyunsaturated fatty acid synthase PfaD [Ilumatobacter coccineus YM16-304]
MPTTTPPILGGATIIGGWRGVDSPAFADAEITSAIEAFRSPSFVVIDPQTGRRGIATGGSLVDADTPGAWPVSAALPAMYPEWLGDRSFNETHGARFPYVTGAMANGIATTRLVIEIARAGGLGFFGAAGLSRDVVSTAIDELVAALGHDDLPWGCNLIHSPQEPALEAAVADLYITRGVRRVSAAAYMSLTPAIVRYAYHGVHVDAAGVVRRPNAVFAKISRPEVARHFVHPAPPAMLDALVAEGLLTRDEAQLAARLPVAEDITVESDSGGHTDNRPLGPLFSSIQAVRDEAVAAHGYTRPIRLGAAGGIGTPQAAAAAFGLGAAYVLTGTVNEACVESGLSTEGKQMLAAADIADVAMAPAADMFELGVDLQVLKRGTMFAPRARRLHDLYTTYASLDEIPRHELDELEQKILGASVDESWRTTREFWNERDPEQVAEAERNPRHKMALTFRSYLGLSSRWSIDGATERRLDFQIWCGPAMGAFNAWVSGSFLDDPANRTVAQVAKNLLEGAAVTTRAHQFRTYGVPVPAPAFRYHPRPLD